MHRATVRNGLQRFRKPAYAVVPNSTIWARTALAQLQDLFPTPDEIQRAELDFIQASIERAQANLKLREAKIGVEEAEEREAKLAEVKRPAGRPKKDAPVPPPSASGDEDPAAKWLRLLEEQKL
jgi:hypothetical protein